ncbi:MAG: NERD domain-containing protein [Coriobacteriia bacterium]|nr:NERD domain-containing protein [Coriobacteriia bacterium]
MACTIGIPGESAWHVTAKRASLALAIILIMAAIITPLLLHAIGESGWFAAAVGVALGLAVTWKQYRAVYEEMRDDIHPWAKGATGEMRTAKVLDALPDTFAVFHDYHPANNTGVQAKWNYDHVVVGPTGVFVVETKNYSNARVPDATSSPVHRRNVQQVQRNAKDFKESLVAWSSGDLSGLFVVPLLVYVQDSAWVKKTRENYVRVVPLRWLESEILRHAEKHIDQQRTYRVARVLFAQLSLEVRAQFEDEFARFAEQSKTARAERSAEQDPDAGPCSIAVAPIESDAVTPPDVCPRCGAPLVRRVANRGARVGKAFLGCSKYGETRCKYVFNIED